MDDQDEFHHQAPADNEVGQSDPPTASGSSGDPRPVSPDNPEHMPPSPSPSTVSPAKRAKLLLASSLPTEEVLQCVLVEGTGLTPWKQDLVLITENPTAFQTGGFLLVDRCPIVRSTAVRHDDQWCWVELHSEGLSSEKFELPTDAPNILVLTHSATVFHAAAPASAPRALKDAEGTWRTQAARSQVWRASGWDGSLIPTDIGFTNFFIQAADPEDQSAPEPSKPDRRRAQPLVGELRRRTRWQRRLRLLVSGRASSTSTRTPLALDLPGRS